MPDAKIVVRQRGNLVWPMWEVWLVARRNEVCLTSQNGNEWWDNLGQAKSVAKWWSERTGIPVEVEE